MDPAVNIDLHARDREAALLPGFLVVAAPLDLGIGERDDRGIVPDAIDEQTLRYAQLRRREADPEGVAHDRRHPLDLDPERVVEAIDRSSSALQRRIAPPPDERHGRGAPGFDLGI